MLRHLPTPAPRSSRLPLLYSVSLAPHALDHLYGMVDRSPASFLDTYSSSLTRTFNERKGRTTHYMLWVCASTSLRCHLDLPYFRTCKRLRVYRMVICLFLPRCATRTLLRFTRRTGVPQTTAAQPVPAAFTAAPHYPTAAGSGVAGAQLALWRLTPRLWCRLCCPVAYGARDHHAAVGERKGVASGRAYDLALGYPPPPGDTVCFRSPLPLASYPPSDAHAAGWTLCNCYRWACFLDFTSALPDPQPVMTRYTLPRHASIWL